MLVTEFIQKIQQIAAEHNLDLDKTYLVVENEFEGYVTYNGVSISSEADKDDYQTFIRDFEENGQVFDCQEFSDSKFKRYEVVYMTTDSCELDHPVSWQLNFLKDQVNVELPFKLEFDEVFWDVKDIESIGSLFIEEDFWFEEAYVTSEEVGSDNFAEIQAIVLK